MKVYQFLVCTVVQSTKKFLPLLERGKVRMGCDGCRAALFLRVMSSLLTFFASPKKVSKEGRPSAAVHCVNCFRSLAFFGA